MVSQTLSENQFLIHYNAGSFNKGQHTKKPATVVCTVLHTHSHTLTKHTGLAWQNSQTGVRGRRWCVCVFCNSWSRFCTGPARLRGFSARLAISRRGGGGREGGKGGGGTIVKIRFLFSRKK